MVDDRTVQHAAQPTGGVGVLPGEGAVAGPVVGHDLVAGGVVGLDEHDVIAAAADVRPSGIALRLRRSTGATRADSPRTAPVVTAETSQPSHCISFASVRMKPSHYSPQPGGAALRGATRLAPCAAPAV